MRLTNLSFEEWIEHAFSREVRIQQAAWYFDPNHDLWDPKPVEAVAYLTRLFEDPERTLCWFSDDQIAQGLTYIVGTSGSGDNGWLSAIEVPVEARVRCVEAIGKLFDRLFAPRCTPHLSHLSEVAAGTLNCVCYMWWDEFPCIAATNIPAHCGPSLATTSRPFRQTQHSRAIGPCLTHLVNERGCRSTQNCKRCCASATAACPRITNARLQSMPRWVP